MKAMTVNEFPNLSAGDCSSSPQFASRDLSKPSCSASKGSCESSVFLELLFAERSNSKNSKANSFPRGEVRGIDLAVAEELPQILIRAFSETRVLS